MKVADVMTRGVETCSLDDSLAVAAQVMWDADCGCVPVLDVRGDVVAMITDRDVAMAALLQGKALAEISVRSAASHELVSVHEDDDVHTVEGLMRVHQIRRVPVLDGTGEPIGIVSLNDLARRSEGVGKSDGLSASSVARTLAAVSRPRVAAHAASADAE